MKLPLHRRPAPPVQPEPALAAEPLPADDAGQWPQEPPRQGGWSTGATANTSAVLRWAAWALIVASPLLSLTALTTAPDQATARTTASPTAAPAAGGQGATGFAQRFVAAYVAAGEGDQDRLAAYYPQAADLQLEGKSGRDVADQLTVARLRQTAPDVWSVTVATRISAATKPGPGRVRYFQVPVATATAAGGATAYVALALPAEVAAPGKARTPELVYGPMQPARPEDPRTQTVTAFLSAYLTGRGDLTRYLAPGTRITPIRPAPYTGLAVDQMATDGSPEESGAVPADGTRRRLLVTVRATDQGGVRRPLTYALTLSARAGRWEIAALDGAPTPAPTTTPSPAPTS